jgi:hypothetical protein
MQAISLVICPLALATNLNGNCWYARGKIEELSLCQCAAYLDKLTPC